MNKNKIIMNGLIKFILLTSLFASQCNDRTVVKNNTDTVDFSKEIKGEFEGTYKRVLNYEKGPALAEEESVMFIFFNQSYFCYGSGNNCPPHGRGAYGIEGNSLIFNDTTQGPFDFDSSLLISGEFEISLAQDNIILSRYDQRNDISHYISIKKIVQTK